MKSGTKKVSLMQEDITAKLLNCGVGNGGARH